MKIFFHIFSRNLVHKFHIHTAKPVGSECIGEQQNATNVSRIMATFWPIHKLRYIDTARHNENYLGYVYRMPKGITYRMYRCRDVTKDVAENVSIYATFFCNDVSRYNALHKHAEPTGFAVLVLLYSINVF